MPDRILIIMPTRGRPWAALEAIASVMKNAAQPDFVKLWFCVDGDDEEQFQIFHPRVDRSWYNLRRGFIEWVNMECMSLMADYAWVAWMGDDVRYLTPGWDDIVRSHEAMVVYGPDGIHGPSLASHPFIRTEIPRALGYLIPPDLKHYYADNFIHLLGMELKSLHYDESLKIEHLHWFADKAPMDRTYSEAHDAFWEQDKRTFETKIRPMIPALAQKVINEITT